MKGILITNAFWQWNKETFDRLSQALLDAAEAQGIDLIHRTNQDFLCALPGLPALGTDVDFVLFWDKDVRLASLLERQGVPVFNSARAIALCDDKTFTHLALSRAGLPMPRTVLCPQTFPANGYPEVDFVRQAGGMLGFPMVVKEGCGSFGYQVYLAQDAQAAARIVREKAGTPLLFQEYIQESAGQDLRLYMVGGRCVAAMRRVNPRDFRANIQHGGHGEMYVPAEEEIDLAAAACRALGLDFAGVDILPSDRGPLICEVNSNAHFHALSALTGADIPGSILSYIRRRIG